MEKRSGSGGGSGRGGGKCGRKVDTGGGGSDTQHAFVLSHIEFVPRKSTSESKIIGKCALQKEGGDGTLQVN